MTILRRHAFKHPAVWISFGWILVIAIVYLSVNRHGLPLPGRFGDKYGHIAAYAAVMFWFVQIYEGWRSRLLIACALVALGIGLEFVQAGLGYRTFERGDMLADIAGVILGWLAGPPRTPNVLEGVDKRV